MFEFADLISSGKLFQSSGAATEKARLSYELRLKQGLTNKCLLEDLRLWLGVYN